MRACATTPAIAIAPAGGINRPVIFINGSPEPRLIVQELEIKGPLDQRTASLRMASSSIGKSLVNRWSQSTTTLLLPNRLVDDQVNWTVLVQGVLVKNDRNLSASSNEILLDLKDAWGRLLDNSLSVAWWQTKDGLLFDSIRPATMKIGDEANRSNLVWSIGGTKVHVFQDGGQAWTVSTAIATISALAHLDLSLKLIPEETGRQRLFEPIDLARSVGDALTKILEAYGLTIQRDIKQESGVVIERRAVRPTNHGRTVRLAWADGQRPLGQVLRIKADRPAETSQLWIAQAKGWLVESTFILVKGWDPSLENQTDEQYSKLNNADYDTYANVFRLWVLNEDGHYTATPYNQGGAFDLGAFFKQTPVRPQPLRFLPAITLGDTGAGRQPLVEMSVDNGTNWSAYAGPVQIRNDRAAVYLDDTTLSQSFLSAAKSGDARIRVTASLQSPIPVQVRRWWGNPFVNTPSTKLFDLGDVFRFQRIEASSIHHDGIINNTLLADQIDQTSGLNDWLVHRIRQIKSTVEADRPGQASLSLVGAWPLLKAGDRLINTSALGTDAAGRAEAIAFRGAIVQSIRCRWSDNKSQDGGNRSIRPSRAPLTDVELNF